MKTHKFSEITFIYRTFIDRGIKCGESTYIDTVGLVSGFQVMKETSFIQVGQEGHVSTHLEFRGVHGLAIIDVDSSFLREEDGVMIKQYA